MKLLLSLSLILSFVISADDHETPEYKYEPEANNAQIKYAMKFLEIFLLCLNIIF